jgi:hypothetical protein
MLKQYPLLLLAAFLCTAGNAQTFPVSYPAAAFSGPFTGKVILYLNKENRNPKDAMADLESFPCFSMDVRAYLRNNWPALEKGLQGKIRVSVSNQDNFLLNYAVHMLDDEMKKLNTQFVFGYYPGDHFTLNTPEYQAAGATFLAQRYAQWKMLHS